MAEGLYSTDVVSRYFPFAGDESFADARTREQLAANQNALMAAAGAPPLLQTTPVKPETNPTTPGVTPADKARPNFNRTGAASAERAARPLPYNPYTDPALIPSLVPNAPQTYSPSAAGAYMGLGGMLPSSVQIAQGLQPRYATGVEQVAPKTEAQPTTAAAQPTPITATGLVVPPQAQATPRLSEPTPPQQSQLYVNGRQFAPAPAGLQQVGGKSVMGDYLDMRRAMSALALAEQNAPDSQAATQLRDYYAAKQREFTGKYGESAANVAALAERRLSMLGNTTNPALNQQILNDRLLNDYGAIQRETENMVFPELGEVAPGMGIATDAQGRVVRMVTGAPSGAPQTVYDRTTPGGRSLVAPPVVVSPQLAAYEGAGLFATPASRQAALENAARGQVPAMAPSRMFEARRQAVAAVAQPDLTKILGTARGTLGLPPSPEANLTSEKNVKAANEALTQYNKLTGDIEAALLSDDTGTATRLENERDGVIGDLTRRGATYSTDTGRWQLPGAPTGLAATKPSAKSQATAYPPSPEVNLAALKKDLEKARGDWESKWKDAKATGDESALQERIKEAKSLDIAVTQDKNGEFVFAIPREEELPKPNKPGANPSRDEIKMYTAFWGQRGRDAALKRAGYSLK